MKKIIKVWLDNLINYNKYIFETIDMYYSIYDILIFYNSNDDIINLNIPDGNIGCDITLNLLLTHLIIKHILYLIQDKYNKDLSFICNKITKNYRVGIYQNFTNNIIADIIDYSYNEIYNLYLFFISYQDYYQLNCFNHTTQIINNELKIIIPWIIERMYNILLNENFMQNNINFYFIILNLIDINNL